MTDDNVEETERAQPEAEAAEPEVLEATAPAPAEALTEKAVAGELKKATGLKAADAVDWLSKLMPAKSIGGLQLDGVRSLDPTKKKMYGDYLTKSEYKGGRDRLKERINSWIEVLEGSDDTTEASDALSDKITALNGVFEENQTTVLDAVRPLEKSYRMLDAFFVNAQKEAGDKVDCWTYNASGDALMDSDDRSNFETLAGRLQEEFRSFSMRKNYGMMVVPGWLGDVKQIDRLAELAFQNKLLAVSDGPDQDSADALLEYISNDAFAAMMGPDPAKRNIALYCNYLLARTKNEVESEEFYVPPSMHVAGAIYRGDVTDGIHQSRAGFFHGKLQNAVASKFKVDRPKATKLMQKHGLNATVGWDGYPVVVGDQNLSTETGRNSYSKIRTEDWICKNVLNFLNYQAFQAINTKNLDAWKQAIYKFLDGISDRQGKKTITGFDVKVVSSDKDRRENRVRVELKVEYQHMVRYFHLRMRDKDGQKEAELEEG